jgi:soluble lytic murein transglycosylase
MRLGMAELASDLSDWGGSYILSAAAYNAGPGNVKKWIAEHGDPRDARVDPIDWIEQIPFNETRNYVMRVLENTEVYRNRIAGRDEPLRILADLYKPNAPQTKPLDYTPPPPAPPAVAVPVPVPKPAAPNSAASL